MDPSNGWNAVAAEFMARRDRSNIGVATVQEWAATLPAGGSILDIGCGHGTPISTALVKGGFAVYGIDASPDLVGEFRRRLPEATVRCEAVEVSTFYGREFDAAVAVGLMFLLPAETQRRLIHRVAAALIPGGRFLFSAPTQEVVWADILTGRKSRSLGKDAYGAILREAGLELAGEFTDEGESHYYSTAKS